jgi:hypothetical protein
MERVVGCEAELALVMQGPYGLWSAEGSLRAASIALREYMPPQRYPLVSDTVNHFYENGQRIYIDCGDHIEVSTAESVDSREVAAGHLAGLMLVHRALKAAHGDGRISNYSLSDRVVSDNEAWGFHENYLVSRAIAPGKGSSPLSASELTALLPFLAVRSQIGGAGSMRGDKFYLGQKASRITHEVSNDTMVAKPLINTRDQPHANWEKYARLHIPCADPVSPHILRGNLDMTSLVLRMIERGQKPRLDYEGNNWAAVAKNVAADLTLTREIRGMTALDVHEKYLNTLEPIVRAGVPEREERAYQEWIPRYEKLRDVQSYAREHAGDPDIIAIVGRYIVAEVAGGHQFDWAERLALAYDGKTRKLPNDRELDYDLVSTNGKLGTFWARTKTEPALESVPRSLLIERMHTPPPGRPEDRAQFIHDFAHERIQVDWHELVYKTRLAGNVTLKLDEPAVRTTGYTEFLHRIAQAKIEDQELTVLQRQARGDSSPPDETLPITL